MKGFNQDTLIKEETKAVTLFIWLFYIILALYDLFYYYLLPLNTGGNPGLPKGGLGWGFYLANIGLLPFALYLIRMGRPFQVKYLFFAGFFLIDFSNSMLIYLGESKEFQSGSAIELLFILFAPIFVNKRYFWIVSGGMIGKYLLAGLLLSSQKVMVPIVLMVIFSSVSYVLLNRFYSYIHSLTHVFQELRQTEKLAAVGQIASAVGHEVRNPLAALRGFTQLQMEKHPEDRDRYKMMIEEIDRINLIADDLMILSKPRLPMFKRVELNAVIHYVLSIIKEQAANQNIHFETENLKSLPKVQCDEHMLKQAFINLIKNAVESMTEGGTIVISAKLAGGGQVLISIKDEGCGIDAENMERVADPFYTTKPDGTGLGLMVTKQIMNDHKAEIIFESEVGKGTIVNLFIPIEQPAE
ncbi:two-component sensor histidine kinase [Paenibacillus sp. FSL R5-0490]|uniref:ATP-binding protein n=1 Tax=Bacillales TaxID=1385 RepID=UPI00096CE9CC|nr:ATP-binding protein [Paenibacillus sp. FSL R5-0490]OMF61095.1 two-component sensor histidine kinase [Paenibacillus sp. FSL R5-0490]